MIVHSNYNICVLITYIMSVIHSNTFIFYRLLLSCNTCGPIECEVNMHSFQWKSRFSTKNLQKRRYCQISQSKGRYWVFCSVFNVLRVFFCFAMGELWEEFSSSYLETHIWKQRIRQSVDKTELWLWCMPKQNELSNSQKSNNQKKCSTGGNVNS